MSKYPNDYYPKLQYWTERLLQAIKNEDIHDVDHIHNKLNYFIGAQHGLEMARDLAHEEQAHKAFYSANL